MENNTESHHMPVSTSTQAARIGVAILYLATSVILATPYTACVVVMIKTKTIFQYSSYKLMVVIGFTDLAQVFFSGILSGIYGLFNFPVAQQSRVPGALMHSTYEAYVFLTTTLAIERCVKTWWPNTVWEMMFGGKKLYFAILTSLSYGGSWFMLLMWPGGGGAFYDPNMFIWIYTIEWDPVADIVKKSQKYATIVILIVSYSTIGAKMRLMKQSSSNSCDAKREMCLLYQCVSITSTFFLMIMWWQWIAYRINDRSTSQSRS